MRWRNIHWGLLVLAAAGGMFGAGCGPRRPATAPVRGTVTLRGEPVPEGRVFFYPEEGRPALGRLQPDGTYELTTFKPRDGAVPGRHRVVIQATRSTGGAQPRSFEEELAGMGGEPGELVWLVPKPYSRRETTPLAAEVGTGRNVLDFDLQK